MSELFKSLTRALREAKRYNLKAIKDTPFINRSYYDIDPSFYRLNSWNLKGECKHMSTSFDADSLIL